MTGDEMKAAGYYALLGEIYRFLQYHGKPDSSDEFWQQTIEEAGALAKRYEGTPLAEFAKRLVLDTMDEVERVYKRTVPKLT